MSLPSNKIEIVATIDRQFELITRGCEHIYSLEELRHKLERSAETATPLRVKLGMDPTAPDLTFGHAVVLGKMRDFQDAGHRAVLIIGDYTARIGDPSGKSKTRPVLSVEEVDKNAQTYFDQAGKIIDLSAGKLEIRRNSEWLAPLNFADVIRLAGQVTIARMLERDTFDRRMKAGVEIYMHELFYPVMQAYDSVMVQADVEIGGTDQTFNNLLGRDFQKNAGRPPQVVVIMPLLVGLDGKEKMSKSLGNYIAVTEPAADMFAKAMSISDELMRNYFELLTRIPGGDVERLLDPGRSHPRDAKVTLAKSIVERFHGDRAAESAADEFFRIHGAGKTGLPDDMPEIVVPAEMGVVDLVRLAGFAPSNGEARRLIAENGIRHNGAVLTDHAVTIKLNTGDVLQRGKRKFVRLQVGS